jgi:hypothetical protein
MYLQSYKALCRSFFVVVELKGALNVVFSPAKEGRFGVSVEELGRWGHGVPQLQCSSKHSAPPKEIVF